MAKFQPRTDWNEKLKKAVDSFILLDVTRNDRGGEKNLVVKCVACGSVRIINSVSFRTNHRIVCRTCEHQRTKERAREKAKERYRLKAESMPKKEQIKVYKPSRNLYQLGFSFCDCGQILPIGKRKCDECKRRTARETERRKETKRRIKYFASTDKDITLQSLFERDNGICYLCGKACDWGDFQKVNGTFIVGGSYPTIEHVKPLCKGGTHTWDNVKLACHACNSKKGVKYSPVGVKRQGNLFF